MVDHPQILAIPKCASISETKTKNFSIKDFCRVYFSIIARWCGTRIKSSSRPPKTSSSPQKADPEAKFEALIEAPQELGDITEEEKTMNGIQGLRYNAQNMRQDNPPSPRGFYKHKSVDNIFSHLPSFSRSGSRSPSPTPSFLQRNMSRRSTDNINGYPASLSRSSTRRSSTPIMFSNSTGMVKPPAIQKNLECTLEELCYGCTKKVKVTREVLTNTGQVVQEEEILKIKVKPGWKRGTKITFEGMGNERPGCCPADITFVIAEKRHPLFRREGDDLEIGVEIPLVKALTGCEISVPLLGGEQMRLVIDDIICPGYEKIIQGQGMPNNKEQGKRGNLKVVFLVEFPTDLTVEQRSDIVNILGEGS